MRRALGRAESKLNPAPTTEIYEVKYDDKTVVAVDVLPNPDRPVLAEGTALMRVGPSVRPITPDRIVPLLHVEDLKREEVGTQIKNLAETIGKQSDTIEALRKQIAEGSRWPKKIKDWVWGGLIGAIIGLLLAAALGIG